MSSVAPAGNPGMTYLTQLLSGSSSPLLSGGMSSSQVQSVLQDSSPSDLVQLSDQALQLQNIATLFASQDTSQTTGLPSSTSSSAILDSILATISTASSSTTPNASGNDPQTASSSATSSLASQIASYQGQLQEESTQAWLGTNSTTGVSGGSLNVFA